MSIFDFTNAEILIFFKTTLGAAPEDLLKLEKEEIDGKSLAGLNEDDLKAVMPKIGLRGRYKTYINENVNRNGCFVKRLDHANIRTANLQGMIEFYVRALKVRIGPRPGFGFPGAWLYIGECQPIIHLVEIKEQPKRPESLQLEHFALQGSGTIEAFVENLEKEKIEYSIAYVKDFGISQVNVFDVDGNHFHVDFSSK